MTRERAPPSLELSRQGDNPPGPHKLLQRGTIFSTQSQIAIKKEAAEDPNERVRGRFAILRSKALSLCLSGLGASHALTESDRHPDYRAGP